eukprot:1140026-Pelagomonas_calceolata.AAC.9
MPSCMLASTQACLHAYTPLHKHAFMHARLYTAMPLCMQVPPWSWASCQCSYSWALCAWASCVLAS